MSTWILVMTLGAYQAAAIGVAPGFASKGHCLIAANIWLAEVSTLSPRARAVCVPTGEKK